MINANFVNCKHEYRPGKALVNLATNGDTTDHDKWKKGQGIYSGKTVRTIQVEKCIHCGEWSKDSVSSTFDECERDEMTRANLP